MSDKNTPGAALGKISLPINRRVDSRSKDCAACSMGRKTEGGGSRRLFEASEGSGDGWECVLVIGDRNRRNTARIPRTKSVHLYRSH